MSWEFTGNLRVLADCTSIASQAEILFLRLHTSFIALDPLGFGCLRIVGAEVEAGMPLDVLDVGYIELCDLIGAGSGEISYQWEPKPKWVSFGSICGDWALKYVAREYGLHILC